MLVTAVFPERRDLSIRALTEASSNIPVEIISASLEVSPWVTACSALGMILLDRYSR